MENTIENKQKFFAQYWGQKILMSKTLDNNDPILKTIFHPFSWDYNVGYLELTPLSKITDEDAIEVARLAMNNDSWERYRLVENGLSVGGYIDTYTLRYEVFIGHPSVNKWLLAYDVQIDTEDGEVVLGNYENGGKDYYDDIPRNYIQITDYLRSKGYAVPFNGVSVETLIEWGWTKIR